MPEKRQDLLQEHHEVSLASWHVPAHRQFGWPTEPPRAASSNIQPNSILADENFPSTPQSAARHRIGELRQLQLRRRQSMFQAIKLFCTLAAVTVRTRPASGTIKAATLDGAPARSGCSPRSAPCGPGRARIYA